MKVLIQRSGRSKYMRLRVAPGGAVTLVVPMQTGAPAIDAFLKEHDQWLRKAVARMLPYKSLPVSGRQAYLTHRERARAFIHERLGHWNTFYGFSWQRVAIKNQCTVWGSCSQKGNLNFSYALLFLPPVLSDYVIVHELCHLRENNHSPRFWALVEEVVPDYRDRRRELKRYVLR